MRYHPSFIVFVFLNVKSHVLFRVPFWDFQNLAYFFSNLADLEVRKTPFPRHWSGIPWKKCYWERFAIVFKIFAFIYFFWVFSGMLAFDLTENSTEGTDLMGLWINKYAPYWNHWFLYWVQIPTYMKNLMSWPLAGVMQQNLF